MAKVAGQPAETVIRTITEAIDTVREGIDSAIGELEKNWISPTPDALTTSSAQIGDSLRDKKDLPILAAAKATSCEYLLSSDEASFPHGESWGNVWYWHPDTFLTAFFEGCPEAYIDVRLDLADIRPPIPLIPR